MDRATGSKVVEDTIFLTTNFMMQENHVTDVLYYTGILVLIIEYSISIG